MNSSLQFLRDPLADEAMHIDFLRLRCGTERRFQEGIVAVNKRMSELRAEQSGESSDQRSIHTFISFSEWDAVVVVPSSELYPRTLTEIYANRDVAASVSGTSGYFAYLWNHPVNKNWPERLTAFERSGPLILTSFRFADWFRRDVGLGAELLFCDYLQSVLESDQYRGLSAIVAHSLGWNDVILFTHGGTNEAKLTDLLADIRLTTLENCVRDRARYFQVPPQSQIFAASYTHLLGGFGPYLNRELSLGAVASQIQSARILVRVAPPHEKHVREFMNEQRHRAGVKEVPSEMGHYSLSMDISKLKEDGGRPALSLIADVRDFIGGLPVDGSGEEHARDSYAETTTIFRFEEPPATHPAPPDIPIPDQIRIEIATVERVMGELPHLLRQLGASEMTSHRFASVLLTLLDHLSDPVRSSVVRHLSRFAKTIPDLVRELDPDGIDDLCHVLEYAVGQAIDGIAQFQHDANALGLSGRGGYSRLIVTVEWYARSTYAQLGILEALPLITFGLRSGNAGSTRRYQIDIPFNVLFVPGRWHNLLHEVGHLAWQYSFGWMLESLAIYKAMETEIRLEAERTLWKDGRPITGDEAAELARERVHVEFLRTREILRELFPRYLIFALPCGGNLPDWDALMIRQVISLGHPSSVTRQLLLVIVTHCLIEIMDGALREGGPTASAKAMRDSEHAAAWWGIWEPLRGENHLERVRSAVREIGDAITMVSQTAQSRPDHGGSGVPPNFVGMNKQILESGSMETAAVEALRSTIHVLELRGKQFRDPDPSQLGPTAYGRLLSMIARMRHEQSDYQSWFGEPFARCLHAGEVFPKHRDAFIWSRLLLASRKELIAGGHGSLMRSALSVLLSMWHDAVTEGHLGPEKLGRMMDLEIIRPVDSA